MPDGHDATIEVCNIMSFVLYTQILKQSVLKPASPGITLNKIEKWCIENGFRFSPSKTVCVHFHRKRGTLPEPDLKLNGEKLKLLKKRSFLV